MIVTKHASGPIRAPALSRIRRKTELLSASIRSRWQALIDNTATAHKIHQETLLGPSRKSSRCISYMIGCSQATVGLLPPEFRKSAVLWYTLHDDAPAGLIAATAVARFTTLDNGPGLDDGRNAGSDTGRHVCGCLVLLSCNGQLVSHGREQETHWMNLSDWLGSSRNKD